MLRKVFFLLFVLFAAAAWQTEHSNNVLFFAQSGNADSLLREKLKRKAEKQISILEDTGLQMMTERFDPSDPVFRKLKSESLSLFAYKNKCLVFWSDNITQPYNFPADTIIQKRILRNSGGWYQMLSKKEGALEYYCFYRFYREYPVSNEFFTRMFSSDLGFHYQPEEFILQGTQEKQGNYTVVTDLPGMDQKSHSSHFRAKRTEILYLFSVLCFIVFAAAFAGKNATFNTRLFVLLLSGFGSIFNILAYTDVILLHKRQNALFSPELAAFSPFIPSLGHALLLTVSILLILVFIHQSLQHLLRNDRIRRVWTYLPASLILWTSVAFTVLTLLPAYIMHARVNYDFKYLTNVTEFTLIGLFTVFLFVLIILLINRIVAMMFSHRFEKRTFAAIHLITGAAVLAWAFFSRHENGFLILCLSLYGFILPFWVFFIQKLQFRHLMAVSLLSAAMFAVQFEQVNSYKEQENRKLFAAKLIAKEDLELELKLREIENKMVKASAIDSFFKTNIKNQSDLLLNFTDKYFQEVSRHYQVELMRYDSFGRDIGQNKLKFTYVNSLYNRSTNKSISNYFLFIEDLHFLGAYLAKFEICPADRNIGYVFLMLSPKLKSDQQNLDYFFSRDEVYRQPDEQYTYALYQSGQLVKSLGSFPYFLEDAERYTNIEDETFIRVNGYSQLLKKVNEDILVFVSLRLPTFNQIFTVFTFLLFCFIMIPVLVYLALYIVIMFLGLFPENHIVLKVHDLLTAYLRMPNINKLYLETKIRISFLLMAVLICSVVVYFTIQNVNKSFRENQNVMIEKRMSKIVSELELGHSKKEALPLNNLIRHLAGTNEVDINLYQLDGTLYLTSNSRLFSEGWISPFMHPVAYHALIRKKQHNFRQYDRLGNLEYVSYYHTVFDENHQLMGYVHIPYFSRSIDLKDEFSAYLGSLLNMSTLLLMISLLIASYIGRSLVRPLNLMIESLSRIKPGGHNREIAWHGNDEIGQLVLQYNTMLKKLEESTDKLARSEREGAWKEMAKQVAHEIKNPLTPMKLHLQHLQLAINRNDEHIREKVASISQMLIEQIDQMSRMAEEFSNFAKMPLAVPERCNLNALVEYTVSLFRSQNDLEIQYSSFEKEIIVMVDRDQMIRVLTNIMKNALQAVKDGETCRMSVQVSLQGKFARISVSDNGRGIEEALREKIFQPNFSTKNSGMGLGLAICKKIIEQVNGWITFESEVNKGTTFHVFIPVVTEQKASETDVT